MTRLGYSTDGATAFLQVAIASAAQQRGGVLATDYARSRAWGSDVVEMLQTKASVSGGEDEAGNWAVGLATARAEFVRLVDSTALIGRIPFVHKVAPNTPYTVETNAVAARFVGQSRSIPISTLGLGTGRLPALKAGCIIAVSNELLESADPRALAFVRAAMTQQIAYAIDLAFVGGGAGTTDLEPQAVNYNVSGLSSTGTTAATFAHDLGLMLEGFGGDLSTSFWIANPAIAAKIFLLTGGLGLGSGINPQGTGSLLGVPLYTSTAAESTSNGSVLTLVDGARVVIIDEGLELSKSPDAVLEMSDSGAGRSDTPSAMTTNIISAFQETCTAFRAVRRCNWYAPAGSVVTLSDLDF